MHIPVIIIIIYTTNYTYIATHIQDLRIKEGDGLVIHHGLTYFRTFVLYDCTLITLYIPHGEASFVHKCIHLQNPCMHQRVSTSHKHRPQHTRCTLKKMTIYVVQWQIVLKYNNKQVILSYYYNYVLDAIASIPCVLAAVN